MDIVITDTLTLDQLHEVTALIEVCRQTDNTRGISFLEGEMNAIHNFPAFFLMYCKNCLVSFLSIFVSDSRQCEIYANTLPEYRKQGLFCRLYEAAEQKIREYRIEKIYFVNDPESFSGNQVLRHIGAKLDVSEYLMSYNMSLEPEPQGILTLMHSRTENGELLEVYKEKVRAGSINLELEQNTAFIYHVEIKPKLRGRGYGTEALLLTLQYLKALGYKKILLHVSSSNKIAYHMYSHHGFVQIEQIDYWINAAANAC